MYGGADPGPLLGMARAHGTVNREPMPDRTEAFEAIATEADPRSKDGIRAVLEPAAPRHIPASRAHARAHGARIVLGPTDGGVG
jgi:hypothetical protein